MRLAEADRKPEKIDIAGGVQAAAGKIAGGAQKIIDALRSQLPEERIHRGAALTGLRDGGGDHVVSHFLQDGKPLVVEARRVVVALPPRLAEERIAFEPPLDEPCARRCATRRPGWRRGQGGRDYRQAGRGVRRGNRATPLSRHEQAVFDEIFDACDAGGARGRARRLPRARPGPARNPFSDGLPLLMQSQMEQVFGAPRRTGKQFPGLGTKEADLQRPRPRKRPRGAQAARPIPCCGALWGGKAAPGRVGDRRRARPAIWKARWRRRGASRATFCASPRARRRSAAAVNEDINLASLRRFRGLGRAGRATRLFDEYRRRLNASLAAQNKTQLTQMAMLARRKGFSPGRWRSWRRCRSISAASRSRRGVAR